MCSVTDIKGTLVSDKLITLIKELYSNVVPTIKNLEIKIRGDPTKIDLFMKYVNMQQEYFESMGVESITFIHSEKDNDDVYLISSDDPQDDLDDIMNPFW